jgi:uncharacterized membrane protein YoaK (UPF0700 family)
MADIPERTAGQQVRPGEPADSCLLSFVAGYVDTCVFVGVFGLFTAHVTGNFVLIGAELVHQNGDVLSKILALPVFILAVALTVKAVDALRRAGRAPVASLMYAEGALLVACVGVALALGAPASATAPSALVPGMLAAAAMGLQNGLMRLELASLPSTTVMTINVTQSAIDVVTMLSRRVDPATDAAKRLEARQRFARMWPPIAAFTVGAAAGAGTYALVGLVALAVPALLCIVLGVRFARRTAIHA